MTATGSYASNLASVTQLCALAQAAGAKFLCLPECFSYIGMSAQETVAQASSLEGEKFGAFCELAKTHKLWLSCGGFHEKMNEEKVYNSHVIIDDLGKIVETYRKMHLFDVAIPGGAVLMESKTTTAGPARCCVVDTPVGKIGLTTCYDLRFPEVYVALSRAGADVILVPSAFTVPTGRDHWHLLLRARAVESQCYVAAAAQVGIHNDKRASYGHALGVDPWGLVLADAEEESPTIVTIDIDHDKINKIRTRMPIQSHRRNDVLKLLNN